MHEWTFEYLNTHILNHPVTATCFSLTVIFARISRFVYSILLILVKIFDGELVFLTAIDMIRSDRGRWLSNFTDIRTCCRSPKCKRWSLVIYRIPWKLFIEHDKNNKVYPPYGTLWKATILIIWNFNIYF